MKILSSKPKIILFSFLAIVLVYSALAFFIPFLRWGGAKASNKSVVKIFTTMQNVDFYEPWKAGSQVQLEGCGTIIPGNRILSTAHVVNKANFIEVQKFGETKRYSAKVEQVGFDLDLALLTVEDKDFFKNTEPVEFGDLPSPGDKVIIHGGEELAVKEDTISGLDVLFTWEGARYVPVLLTNNAIDIKNNGCPVFKAGKFIGIPFTCNAPDKKGSILPVNAIQVFLNRIKNGQSYNGFPDMGVFNQNLENPSLRNEYKIPPDQTGIVITKVLYGGTSDGILKEDDVLEAFDGHPIDNQGFITLKNSERVNWYYLFALYSPGDEVPLDILRDGKPLKIKVPLKTLSCLVPFRDDNKNPSYFMFAGFVFTPLTGNYFQTGEWNSFKPELQDIYIHGLPSPEHKQVVIISHVLPNEINTGYDKLTNIIVKEVNGHPITEMKDLITAFDNPMGKFHVIEIYDHSYSGSTSTIVFDAIHAKQATSEIMTGFKIPVDRSSDLK